MHKQVQAYDKDRINAEMARMDEATKRMEAEGKLRMLEAKCIRDKEEDENLIHALEVVVVIVVFAVVVVASETRKKTKI